MPLICSTAPLATAIGGRHVAAGARHVAPLLSTAASPRSRGSAQSARTKVMAVQQQQSSSQTASASDAAATASWDSDAASVHTCFMNEEGYLVCEQLEPGNYVVGSCDSSQEGGKFCSLEHPTRCITYLYVMEDGSMVCEGLPEGQYAIQRASDEEVVSMVRHIWALTSNEESD